jgi:A118 family predicted phage portal protein
MILGLLERIKRWWNADMFTTTNNTKDPFYNQSISDWYALYEQTANFDRKVKSLNLAKSIVDEVGKSAVHEFGFVVNSKNTDLGYVSKFIDKNLMLLVTHLCVGGSVALKPYVEGKRVGVVVVPATNFKAHFDTFGELKECSFKSEIYEGHSVFTLIEDHTYDKEKREYRIDYSLFKANAETATLSGLGSQVPLKACSETAGLDDFVVIEDVDKHLCVVKTLNNTIYQNVGQAIYAGAIEMIYEAYKQYNRIMWEYEGGELAVQANAELFHKVGSSTKNQNYELPQGKERLYIALPGSSNDFDLETYAPTLRDSNYWTGLNNLLRRIEFACGLSYGVLSDANEQTMTATEIISSKQRYYITINSIRSVLCEIIEEVMQNVGVLSGVLNSGLVDTDFKIDFEIEDGILTTAKEKLEEKLLLVDKGVWTVDEFKEWYTKKK